MLAAIALAVLLPGAAGSSGDESWAFRRCLAGCQSTGCANRSDTGLTAEPQRQTAARCSPLCTHSPAIAAAPDDPWLALNRWDCNSDCQYRCMWLLEDSKAPGAAVEKYFGKWPFVRALGMQEPASVAFSLANLAVNVVCLVEVLNYARQTTRRGAKKGQTRRRPRRTGAAALRPWLWTVHFALACNAWVWSSVFHCRDTRTTERFDYFSAGAAVGANLVVTAARISGAASLRSVAAIAAPVVLAYAFHVHRMLTVLFDYGLHVGLCVGVGAVQTVAWAVWALGTNEGRTHPGRKALFMFMAAVNAASLLEVLDFPPLAGALDAHALWHAATAPLTLLWFRFIKADLKTAGTVPGDDN